MGPQATCDRALSRLVTRLRSRYRLEHVILFGSRAHGDALRDSDIDIVVVSPDFAPLDFTTRVLAVLDLWTGGADLEPICLTPEEFRRKRRELGVIRSAVREGIELNTSA